MSKIHGSRNNNADPVSRLDQMPVGYVSVARGRLVPAVSEQLADQRQVFAGHHGLTGHRMAQVVQA